LKGGKEKNRPRNTEPHEKTEKKTKVRGSRNRNRRKKRTKLTRKWMKDEVMTKKPPGGLEERDKP